MTQAYPLQWPVGKPRTKRSLPSRFGPSTVEIARTAMMHELKLLGAKNVVISTNIELRKDGAPYSGRRMPDDRGVAVYFTLKEQARCFACDRWEKIEENITAIRHTIAALCGIERWGGGDMVDQAFSGFTALPSPKAARKWYEVMHCDAHQSSAVVGTLYRNLARDRHPDAPGGSHEAMTELNAAYTEFKRERGLA